MGHGAIASDVFIAGGGPAGLATAIALRQQGLNVVTADFAKPPIDKTCGEGLMPRSVAALKGLGVMLGPAQSAPFHGIRFVGEGRSATGAFLEGYGLGIRRTSLHQALVNRAEEVGVRSLWAKRVTLIENGNVDLEGGTVSCRWIVGADGQNSQVRKWSVLDRKRKPGLRFGFRQHFRIAPWTEFVEVHWGRDCQIVVTPVTPEEICLAVTSRSSQLRLARALSQFPELAKRLEGCEAVSKDLGAISTLHVLPKVWQGAVALVGDASGSVDSLTGEGLGLAFQHASALAEAVAHFRAIWRLMRRRIDASIALSKLCRDCCSRWKIALGSAAGFSTGSLASLNFSGRLLAVL